MGEYSLKRRKLTKLSIGDMRDRITLHTREIQPVDYDSYDFEESYDAGTDIWASVSDFTLSNANRQLFNDVEMNAEGPTHTFGIRYRDWITSETMVRWRGETYDIIKVQDPEERHQYLLLYARLNGDTTKVANT